MPQRDTPRAPRPPSTDQIKTLKKAFITRNQVYLARGGLAPVMRAVFRRFHGGAYGTFEFARIYGEDSNSASSPAIHIRCGCDFRAIRSRSGQT